MVTITSSLLDLLLKRHFSRNLENAAPIDTNRGDLPFTVFLGPGSKLSFILGVYHVILYKIKNQTSWLISDKQPTSTGFKIRRQRCRDKSFRKAQSSIWKAFMNMESKKWQVHKSKHVIYESTIFCKTIPTLHINQFLDTNLCLPSVQDGYISLVSVPTRQPKMFISRLCPGPDVFLMQSPDLRNQVMF